MTHRGTITVVIRNVCDVLKATVATPGSAEQELLQQADEIDFILRHFFESMCQEFEPSSTNASVFKTYV